MIVAGALQAALMCRHRRLRSHSHQDGDLIPSLPASVPPLPPLQCRHGHQCQSVATTATLAMEKIIFLFPGGLGTVLLFIDILYGASIRLRFDSLLLCVLVPQSGQSSP